MVDEQVDILIVGGGLIGAALMLALANSPYRVLMIEALPYSTLLKDDFDTRTLALSPASVTILNMLKLWPSIAPDATSITTIHVSEQGRFATTRLQGGEDNPLGYVVPLQAIQRAVYPLLTPQQVAAPAKLISWDNDERLAVIDDGQGLRRITTQLLIAADGGQSTVRQLLNLPAHGKDYHQHAVIANIGLNRDHHHVAYERFTRNGPLALLPMTNRRSALVWCLPPAEAKAVSALPEPQFLRRLQQVFGYKLGRFIKVGERAVYPLKQIVMPETVQWPVIFVGNAARTLHPVAGQGFNLGLRDMAALAQVIVEQGINPAMVEQYQAMRLHDQQAIIHFTDGLVTLFGSRIPGLGAGRNLGMMVMDNAPLLKFILSHYARGYAGVVSDLACGITLT
ncbi:2-octaprenyl-6-methoxyphenyl hydroxylase [Legionella taurinensis]|uniref:2-octaprenyl-6-methoxyphenyl hydroxylase n=1 Tax=Legionella taurinensis TaxID=70611 RepID=A0A3A5L4C7_9GAMM|nr:FAD-dependent monooxygenase [Legionella taurinensis]MDX1836178.1 FAD-dependent monooxygenase [Legionella taurinensis]PUT42055.1 2-octaprenyl-6-methoxyphenyl hydroxylase [Legionella taurinensis]PUT44842.1 2-octaprenyl-6-methoxyphenyl hydroxylase [Legionella taurinensis]PUT48163.1 2-octaprenyl-6-methoxyphenyl hydroxylase [Legionella taurinensis]PUT48977.1 2-octaprenyl-6-methoxyphenyl hydroxylase [Legionella taurinensis]